MNAIDVDSSPGPCSSKARLLMVASLLVSLVHAKALSLVHAKAHPKRPV